MLYNVSIGNQTYRVSLTLNSGRWECQLDGRMVPIDCVAINSDSISILMNGRSFDVRRAPGGTIFVGTSEYKASVEDPRSWRGRRRALADDSGPLKLTASMPGKVVRVLAQEGDEIAAGQGIVVVEAMKMQNEIKSPKDGILRKVLVREGASVNSGEGLAIVE